MLGLCKQVTSAVSNGVGWEPRNGSSDSNADNREHPRPNMGHTHQAIAESKSDNGVTSTEENDGFSKKYLNNNPNGSAVHIDMPNNINISPSNDKSRIPQEKFKTFVGK